MEPRIAYYIVVVVAAFFAWIYQIIYKKSKRKTLVGRIFLWSSYLLMAIFLGTRLCGVGVDDRAYLKIFNEVNDVGVLGVFTTTMREPGYLLLNRVVGLFSSDFQVMIFVIAALSLFFVYAGMVREVENINLFMAFLLFGLIIYPYYFGILRLSLAVSIAFFATKYIIAGDRKKYNLAILLAATIHYSALILLVMNLIIGKPLSWENLKKFFIKLVVIIPIGLLIVAGVVVPLLSSRYSRYVLDSMSALSISDFDKLLIIVFGVVFSKITMKKVEDYPLYLFMYSLTIVITLCSIFVQFGRAAWYFNIYACVVIPSVISALWSNYKRKLLNFVLMLAFVLYGVLYSERLTSLGAGIVYIDRYENVLIKGLFNGQQK